MRRDAVIEGFWKLKNSEYAKFLHVQALHWVLNIPKYG